MAVLVFIIILSLLVMLHELGHFLMAKRSKIGVEEFGFGLPPRIWGKKVGETIYSINWLPFGGFVRLVGEDSDDPKAMKAKNSFQSKPIGQRTMVVLAGVAVNFILAVVIFYFVVAVLGFKVSLPLLVEHKFKFVNQDSQVLVMDITPGSPAEAAGIQPAESILKVNGADINSTQQLQSIIRSSQDKELTLVLENPVNNSTREAVAVPKYNEQLKSPALGVGLGELGVLKYDTFPQKLFSGFIHSYNTVEYSFKIFGQLIGYAVRERDITPVSEGVSGPVGIAQITSQAVALGPLSVLQLFGLLSLNLALINVLPIPALDGGRFLFIFIEAVTRRRVYPKFEKWAHTIGFVVLLGLIVLVTYNDILKLLR
ncbi:site-2 protease family protein [Candidatus Curtissbacteria bacterium]|nr:site-2 protease family protein [Candidatus Curtissbacteria bacterium]